MKNNIIILLHLLILFSSCKGQNNNQLHLNNKMETIYAKQIENFTIEFLRNNESNRISWETVFVKNETRKIIFSDKTEKNIGWKSQEERGESPLGLYNVAGSYYDNTKQMLYIIYNRFGDVFIHKYHLENDTFSKKAEKKIANYVMSGGFGNLINTADFLEIKDKIYFILTVGQSSIKNPTQLFVLDSNSLESMKKIKFSLPEKIIKTLFVNEFGKSFFEQEKENINDKNETLVLVRENVNKKFFFIDMPLDKEKYDARTSELHDYGISNFNLFLKDNSQTNQIDKNKIKSINNYFSEALNSSINVLGYLFDEGQENTIYFFGEEKRIFKIYRFNSYTSELLISNFSEN